MSEPLRCASCGLLLDPPGPGGLCPVCLLKMGLDASAGTEGAGTETAGTETVSSRAADVPGVIGPYHLLQALGEGGMGLVYLAEQREPLVRRVALKLIKPGMDTREVLARFEAERQALALMDHPNIARVLDAGLGPGDRPYFVMEYVAGIPITAYCDRHRLRNAERLQIFLQVCSALQHAHQKGIIHRDLKPSNILVTVQDGKPVPKVIDFGIAKATRQGSLERAAFTQLGMLIGTPEYISPEQAEASGLEVDTTTDIYSLGVVLYELLTGVLPFDSDTLRRAGYAEMHRIIREQDPPKPSLRVTALGATAADIARQHQTTTPALGKQLRGDLDAIAMKAMEKDRTRRYASASEFAADITRYLNGEAVVASSPSVLYRTRKFVRRHRLGVAAAALVATALVGGLTVSTTFFIRADRAQRVAAQQSYLANLAAADMALRWNDTSEAKKRLISAPASLRGWEWNYLYATTDSSVATVGSEAGSVVSVAFTSDGSRVLALSETGALQAIDSMTRLPVDGTRYPSDRGPVPESVIAVSPDGSRYVSIAWSLPPDVVHSQPYGGGNRLVAGDRLMAGEPQWPEAKRTLTVREAASGAVLARLVMPAVGVSLPIALQEFTAFQSGVTHVAFNLWGFFDMATGRDLRRMSGRDGVPACAAFSSDGRRLVAWSWDNVLRIWDLDTGRTLGTLDGYRDGISDVAWIRNNTAIVSASYDGTLRIWQIGAEAAPRILTGHDGGVTALAVSRDGRVIASGGSDNTIRLWDALAGLPIATLGGHVGELRSVALSPDGSLLATTAVGDNVARLWNVSTREPEGGGALVGHAAAVNAVAFSPDGRQIVTGSSDETIRIWSTAGMRSLRRPGVRNEDSVTASVPSANLERIATYGFGGGLRVWDLTAPGKFVTVTSPGDKLLSRGAEDSFALSTNGQRVLSVAREHALLVFTVGQSGHMLLQGLSGTITALALSPDGNLAAAASVDQSICVWDLRSGRTAHTIRTLAQARVLAFSPDGRWLAAAIDRAVTIWDVDAETPRVTLEGHAANVTSVAFSPDGSRLASGGSDLTVRLWDARTGVLLATGSGHQFDVRSVAFDPTGTRLVSASAEGARIWDTQVLEVLLTVRPGGSVAAFSADGSRLLLGEKGTARILDSRSAYHPDAERMVTDMFARHHLAREVVKALRQDVASDRRVRETAIEMAERRGDNPEALNTESWRIVKRADATATEYGRALAYADRATTLAPSSRSYLNTLGVARYRTGDWKAALVTLERAAAMREVPSPGDLAFLAMAHQRLGQRDAALAALEQHRAEMKKPDNGNNEVLRGFLREAEALVTGVGAKPAAPVGAQK